MAREGRELSERMSAEAYRQLAGQQKPSKYRNQPTWVDGIRFASKREARRYTELTLLQAAGAIRHLEYRKAQLRFPFDVNGVRVGVYEADFSYEDVPSGRWVVEDVKSAQTKKLPMFRRNLKMMREFYHIEVCVVEYT